MTSWSKTHQVYSFVHVAESVPGFLHAHASQGLAVDVDNLVTDHEAAITSHQPSRLDVGNDVARVARSVSGHLLGDQDTQVGAVLPLGQPV